MPQHLARIILFVTLAILTQWANYSKAACAT
jgi:hypothetical protein